MTTTTGGDGDGDTTTTGGDGDTGTDTTTTGGDGDTGTDTTTTGGDGDTGTDTTGTTTGGDGDGDTTTGGDGDGDTTTGGDGDGDTTTGGDGDTGACLDDGLDCIDNGECCGGFCYQASFQGGATCQSSCIMQVQDGECDDDEDCCGDNVCVPSQGGFVMICQQDPGTTGGCAGSGEMCSDSSECCSSFCIPGGPNAGTCA